MTESQEGTNKPYSEEEAYLYETYVTEDGIEVPPPTKMMGPRRLARYREEAAEYIRAMGRGKLPEPVDHMGPVVNNLVVDPRVLSIQRRFAALAAQGAIDMSANDEDKLNEPEPLTSSLNAIKPNQQQQKSTSKDPSDLSALNIPLTSPLLLPHLKQARYRCMIIWCVMSRRWNLMRTLEQPLVLCRRKKLRSVRLLGLQSGRHP